jgi:hypothetical protein
VAREQKQHRDYWIGEVFFSQGRAWGVAKTLKTVCLGREEDILSVVKDGREIPEYLSPTQRLVLAQLLELMEAEYGGRKKTGRFSITERAGRSFRGQYRYHR